MNQTTNYPHKIQLSDTAEAVIAGYAVDLLLDNLQFWQLPDALQEFYTYAFEAGRTVGLESREGIDRLEYQVNYWHWIASNRGKTGADFMNHQTSALWQEAVTQ